MKLTAAHSALIREVVVESIAHLRTEGDPVRDVEFVSHYIGRPGKGGRNAVLKAIKAGKLRATLIGKSYAILDSAIKDWLASQPKKKSGSAPNTLQAAAPQPSRTEA